MPTPFRCIWFTAPSSRNWNLPDNEICDWRDADMYRNSIRVLEERGRLDAVVFADFMAIPTIYGGNTDIFVKHGVEQATVFDSLALLGAVAGATKHIGLIPTLSTSIFNPRLLAQVTASLDHLSSGRGAWNIVTSMGQDISKNFGFEELLSGDQRYDAAEDFVEEVREYYRTAQPTADPAFKGLRMPPPPQGQVVFMQAGGSDRGRDFAAKHAEIVICHRNSVPAMKSFRDDMLKRMAKFGRDSSTCKIFFTIKLIPGRTRAEAEAIHNRRLESVINNLESGLANFAFRIGYDVSKLPVDEPLPADIASKMTGSQGVLQQHTERAAPTLREIGMAEAAKESFVVMGTPGEIADQLAAAMDEVGGDGFALRDSLQPSLVVPVIDEVMPILRARGLTRSHYRYRTLRENLQDPEFNIA